MFLPWDAELGSAIDNHEPNSISSISSHYKYFCNPDHSKLNYSEEELSIFYQESNKHYGVSKILGHMAS
jgi:hypothetical protein